MLPKKIRIELHANASTSFVANMAAASVDLDVKKKLTHILEIDKVEIPDTWNIGVICGNSGSGKTTLAKHIFGEDIFSEPVDFQKAIIDQFSDDMDYKARVDVLTGVGLSQVPCWIKPLGTLSNGQQQRAMAGVSLSKEREPVVMDEWTSVVDRTVAAAMSHCLQKYTRKKNKKVILLTCHYDVIAWLKPDFLIDCNLQKFLLPEKMENENDDSNGPIVATITV